MGKIHTSASIYRRGISDRYPRVGANIQGNYCVVQNPNLFKKYIQPPNYSNNNFLFNYRQNTITFS